MVIFDEAFWENFNFASMLKKVNWKRSFVEEVVSTQAISPRPCIVHQQDEKPVRIIQGPKRTYFAAARFLFVSSQLADCCTTDNGHIEMRNGNLFIQHLTECTIVIVIGSYEATPDKRITEFQIQPNPSDNGGEHESVCCRTQCNRLIDIGLPTPPSLPSVQCTSNYS